MAAHSPILFGLLLARLAVIEFQLAMQVLLDVRVAVMICWLLAAFSCVLLSCVGTA